VGVRVLFDAVLNHKAGADYSQVLKAKKMDEKDRRRALDKGGREVDIEAWTGFNFPGREGRHSELRWDSNCFTGVDYDHTTQSHGVWKLAGKEWADDVDEELGNYDFLWVSLFPQVLT
jgi:alpha-amylase